MSKKKRTKKRIEKKRKQYQCRTLVPVNECAHSGTNIEGIFKDTSDYMAYKQSSDDRWPYAANWRN